MVLGTSISSLPSANKSQGRRFKTDVRPPKASKISDFFGRSQASSTHERWQARMKLRLEPVPVDQALASRWLDRLKAKYGQELTDLEEIRAIVEHTLASAPMLMLEKNVYIERLILLQARLSPEQKSSALVQGVMRRVMRNLDWRACYRLEFLEEQLMGRPVSPNELNFGPGFVPPNWIPEYPPDDDPNEGDDAEDFEI